MESQKGLILRGSVRLGHHSLLSHILLEVSISDLLAKEVLFSCGLRFVESGSVLIHPLDHVQRRLGNQTLLHLNAF